MDYALIKQLNEQDDDFALPSGDETPRETGKAKWTPLREAPAFVHRYIDGLFSTKSISDLTRSRPMNIDFVGAIEGRGPDMRIDINEIAQYLRQNTKQANIIRMDNQDVFGTDRGALVLFYDVDGYMHMVIKKGPTEVILRWPSSETRQQVFAVGGTMTGPAARRQITHHVHEAKDTEKPKSPTRCKVCGAKIGKGGLDHRMGVCSKHV